jgi:hypothetical protein
MCLANSATNLEGYESYKVSGDSDFRGQSDGTGPVPLRPLQAGRCSYIAFSALDASTPARQLHDRASKWPDICMQAWCMLWPV